MSHINRLGLRLPRREETPWPFGDMPMFGYGMIMIDPPWKFETYSDEGKVEKSADAHYDTMTLDQIAALPIGHLAGKDCLLWMWGTHPMIQLQLPLIAGWGFKYVTGGVWVKTTVNDKLAFGTGYRLRCASEPFFLATNGNPETCRSVRTAIEGPIREHSRKPDEAYAEAERLCPNVPRADLFARQSRPGWTAWGNEITKFDEAAP